MVDTFHSTKYSVEISWTSIEKRQDIFWKKLEVTFDTGHRLKNIQKVYGQIALKAIILILQLLSIYEVKYKERSARNSWSFNFPIRMVDIAV